MHINSTKSTGINEENKEKIAHSLNLKFDPIGPADTASIIVGSVFYGITLILVIYAFFNQKYPPIRAKNVKSVCIIYIGGLLWFVGDIPTNGHVVLVGVWSICKLWCIWFRVWFAYTFSAGVAIRTYALYRVFIQRKPYNGFSFYISIILLFFILAVFCIVGQVVSDDLTVKYIGIFEVCTYVWAFRGACLGLLWVIWFVVVYFVVKIWNIHSSFNERYESIITCILAFIAVLQTTLLHTIEPNYPLILRLRMANTWVDFFVGNACIWVILLIPCYQSIFHRDKYLQVWVSKLQRDGLKREYNISTNPQTNKLSYTRMNDLSFNATKESEQWTAKVFNYNTQKLPLGVQSGLSQNINDSPVADCDNHLRNTAVNWAENTMSTEPSSAIGKMHDDIDRIHRHKYAPNPVMYSSFSTSFSPDFIGADPEEHQRKII